MNQLSDLAYTIWIDYTNKSSDTDPARIASWIIGNIGKLNISINTNYSIDNQTFSPEIYNEEAAILGQMYYVKLVYDLAARAARGIISYENGSLSTMITSIKDSNSSVSWANPNETSKLFVSLAKDEQLKLDNLIKNYNSNRNNIYEVGGYY